MEPPTRCKEGQRRCHASCVKDAVTLIRSLFMAHTDVISCLIMGGIVINCFVLKLPRNGHEGISCGQVKIFIFDRCHPVVLLYNQNDCSLETQQCIQ